MNIFVAIAVAALVGIPGLIIGALMLLSDSRLLRNEITLQHWRRTNRKLVMATVMVYATMLMISVSIF